MCLCVWFKAELSSEGPVRLPGPPPSSSKGPRTLNYRLITSTAIPLLRNPGINPIRARKQSTRSPRSHTRAAKNP
eukprot:667456-Amphidinium_carterae.1